MNCGYLFVVGHTISPGKSDTYNNNIYIYIYIYIYNNELWISVCCRPYYKSWQV